MEKEPNEAILKYREGIRYLEEMISGLKKIENISDGQKKLINCPAFRIRAIICRMAILDLEDLLEGRIKNNL